MAELVTNRLMRRVLRFLDYNAELYVRCRQRGDYHEAVWRLRRVSRLVDVAEQAEREGKSELSWIDRATLELARHHSSMVLSPEKALDFMTSQQALYGARPLSSAAEQPT